MFKSALSVLFSLGLLAPAFLESNAMAVDRSLVPEKYTWNLTDLFPSKEAWKTAKAGFQRRLPEIKNYQGKLGQSKETLYEALALMMDLDRDLARLSNYAVQLNDQDQRDMESLEMRQSIESIAVSFGAAVSFVRPEILAQDPARVRGFVDAEPRLHPYRPFLEDILRRKPHTLSPEEEKIAAQAGNLAGTGYAVHSIFTNADLPYPEITLSTGEKVRLDAAGYTRYRALPGQKDREAVFQAFWNTYRQYTRTLGTSLYSQVKAHIFNKDIHNFPSCLEAALFNYNIPEKVYRQLIADVHANLPTLHRYLELRRRMMGLPTLKYSDLYAPLVSSVNWTFTPEQATEMTLQAVAPLGQEYGEVLARGFAGRWVDWMPSTGKRSGAYSQSTYGVHPYQLQNFTGLYDEVSTLAHEAGHSMHSYLSDTRQPYVTHDYSIFVAEVASTLNENLLYHSMLARTGDDAGRLFLLGSHLDLLRTTLFRQTLFAEFELKIHEMAEKGETLTGDNLTRLYLDLVRQYYGHADGICQVDELYGSEWAYIPHFYYNFYVYQYATSLVASTSITRRILEEAAQNPPAVKARDAYLKMLSAGSTKYPIDLLKDAGVDMATSAPFAAAMEEMNRTMDQIEQILKRKGP